MKIVTARGVGLEGEAFQLKVRLIAMGVLAAPREIQLVLDNDVFTHLRNRQPFVLDKIRESFRFTKTFPAIPSITVFEANYGLQNSFVKGNLQSGDLALYQTRITELIEQSSRILPFDQQAAEISAFVFARLNQKEKKEHWRDLFIVATAISHGFGLATRNTRDARLLASKLPDGTFLRLADWKE